jgi:oligoendopeptidase F
MSLLPFKELPPYQRRGFVPESLDLTDWAQIEPWFDELERRGRGCAAPADLEGWLLAWSELSAVLEEEGSRRHIAMSCHTDDPAAERAFLHFVEQIEPQIKPRQFRLERLYLDQPLRTALPVERYGVFDRQTRVHVELFRAENVALETEETKLGQRYQKLMGSLTVPFRGEEKTLVQMARHLEETDRPTRQEAWELVAKRRLQEAGACEQIFEQQLELRQTMAGHAGFAHYRDYAFRLRGRFDYGPDDCAHFHDAVEQEVMPLLRELQAERRERLGLAALRPWDLAVDPLNRPPLRPFERVEQMLAGTQEMFARLDPELARGFGRMGELQLLDLDNRKGKAPGGYQSTLAEARLPFIFMNAVGTQRDVETILHEAGHAFHALATRDEPLHAYRNPPVEFCEVASMGMELLANEHLDVFYEAPDARRARREHLEGIVEVLAWIATIDAFQHWVYSHPGHSRHERRAAWLGLMDRFAGDVHWGGHEEARASLWHRQLHLFLHPFYYIEYGIAQLGALQLWANSRRDRPRTLAAYKAALALGGARPLPNLFAAAGCCFDFSRQAVAPVASLLRRELAALDGEAAGPERAAANQAQNGQKAG